MRKTQQGYGVLIFILMTIMLVSLLATSQTRNSDTSSMISNNTIAQTVSAQAGLVRARILQCGMEYPSGNNGTTYRVTYPAASSSTAVSVLTCPGNSLNLWSQSDGVSVPSPISGFDAWQYVNDATSMRVVISTNTADRAAIAAKIVTLLGAQATETVSSATVHTITWVIAQ